MHRRHEANLADNPRIVELHASRPADVDADQPRTDGRRDLHVSLPSADVPQHQIGETHPARPPEHQCRCQPTLADPDEPSAECGAGGSGWRNHHDFRPSNSDKNADLIEIRVSDTGCGIPADILPHVFEPFFTTKHGKGTGLGLSISQVYVRSHGGEIPIRSVPGEGTTVRFTLPIASESVILQRGRRRSSRLRTMAYSILVIDDESLTLRTIGRALRERGLRRVSSP